MRQQISFLTQSRFYSPAFNAAIFDGPIRIYFAQYQESLALKVYFVAQQRLKNIFGGLRDTFRQTGANIFVMLYPSNEAFQMSFEESASGPASVVVDRLGADFVIGVRGPVSDQEVEGIYARVEDIFKALAETTPPAPLLRTADEVEL